MLTAEWMLLTRGAPAPPLAAWPTAEALRERWLRPVHARSDEVRRALVGVTSVNEAWQLLLARALLPMTWEASPMRRFGRVIELPCSDSEQRERLRALLQRGDRPTSVVRWGDRPVTLSYVELRERPSTLEDLVAFASDPSGIERAEALADEAAQRLRCFGYVARHGHVWLPRSRSRDDWPFPVSNGDAHLGALRPAPVRGDRDKDGFDALLAFARVWEEPCERSVPWCRPAVMPHPYADLASPARPALAILEPGYELVDVWLQGCVLGFAP